MGSGRWWWWQAPLWSLHSDLSSGSAGGSWLLTSDADTWPLGEAAELHFGAQRQWGTSRGGRDLPSSPHAHIFNAHCCGNVRLPPSSNKHDPNAVVPPYPVPLYPIGYIGTTASRWR